MANFAATILMIAITRYLFVCGFLLSFHFLYAQDDSIDPVADLKPPRNKTELFHDNVDKQQREILRSDGKADDQFTPTRDEDINFTLTKTVGPKGKIDWLQYRIEKDTLLATQTKVKYLKGLENLLKYFNGNWRRNVVNPVQLPDIVDAYERAMKLDIAGYPIDNLVNRLSYDGALNVLAAGLFEKNPGYRNCQYILLRKYFALHPDPTAIFLKLRQNPDIPFLDSMIKVAAYRSPSALYDFAAAGNNLANAIRRVDDPLVRAVSEMASSNFGRWYFPFLDNIMHGKMTRADIDEVRDDSVKYFKLLVKTHLDYRQRALNKDTAYGYRDLEDRMRKKALEVFVNTINALHDVKDPAVRFKVIQPLSSEELYYLAVLSDGIIYTSSFVKGVYPLMMSRAGQHGDSVLYKVGFDKYRKFIKMAAGYNTLSNFLASFSDKANAEKLMQAFVSNLEKSGGLEDGVDVADSYASIVETIKPLAVKMLLNVKANYQRTLTSNSKRGIVIYNLLQKLFLSADTSNHINLSKEFGIPPVYEVPFKVLTNSEGRVILQVFFYGDKDGLSIFPGFKRLFNPKYWKITTSKQWITINSTVGKPVSIYANLPLPEENDEDRQAQEALDSFLYNNNLVPTVVIHRGHSYNAPYTIDQVLPSAKIVFLGSCGGYQIINGILEKAPDAHIIATKQIADAPVNNPFFQLLTEKLRNGKDIEWIPFWKELDKMVTSSIFEDYVPPYKNLGAIFIKAYRIAMGPDEE